MIDDIREEIENLRLEAAEYEMLGGLAATHEDRVANRNRAEHLRDLAAEAQRRLFEREGCVATDHSARAAGLDVQAGVASSSLACRKDQWT
jgi:hypothetical protein